MCTLYIICTYVGEPSSLEFLLFSTMSLRTSFRTTNAVAPLTYCHHQRTLSTGGYSFSVRDSPVTSGIRNGASERGIARLPRVICDPKKSPASLAVHGSPTFPRRDTSMMSTDDGSRASYSCTRTNGTVRFACSRARMENGRRAFYAPT